MEYELGKWLERIEGKIDAILVKLYPEEAAEEKEKPVGRAK